MNRMTGRLQVRTCSFQVLHTHLQPPVSIPLQLLHIHFLEQVSLVNDADALCQAGYFGQDMTGHKDCHTCLAGQLKQEFADLHDPSWVQAVGRFVEQEQAWIMQQGLGQPQSLDISQ